MMRQQHSALIILVTSLSCILPVLCDYHYKMGSSSVTMKCQTLYSGYKSTIACAVECAKSECIAFNLTENGACLLCHPGSELSLPGPMYRRPCRNGFTMLRGYSCIKMYSKISESSTWNDTRALCIKVGSHMLVLDSLEKEQAVADYIKTLPASGLGIGFWLGLHHIPERGTGFFWESTNDPLEWSNFVPDVIIDECVGIYMHLVGSKGSWVSRQDSPLENVSPVCEHEPLI